MNTVKKYLGIIWMLLAPLLVGFMVWQAADKIGSAAAAAKSNIALQWIIILFIFIPICIGLFVFGYYCLKGDYNHLPESSAEITDY
jgi:heme/copper-type cytochrome/quinol oxidase subunit 2